MKPSQEQNILISQRLRSMLKYKDTYEEVYDHVITALEEMPDGIDFFGAVNNIIATELGGAKGIKRIERKYMKFAIKQFIKDYFSIVTNCLTSAITPIIIIATIAFYWLVRNVSDEHFSLTIIETAVCFIPSITQAVMVIKRRAFDTNKIKVTPDYMPTARTWVESINVGWPGMAVLLLDGVVKAEYGSIAFKNHINLDFGVYPITILFFIAIVHSITYYKLYKDMPMKSFSK